MDLLFTLIHSNMRYFSQIVWIVSLLSVLLPYCVLLTDSVFSQVNRIGNTNYSFGLLTLSIKSAALWTVAVLLAPLGSAGPVV